jgi:NADH-quinone oxidoreductase subunit L
MDNQAIVGLIPLLPLAGSLLIGILHVATCKSKRLSDPAYGFLAFIGPAVAFVLSCYVFIQLTNLPENARYLAYTAFTWFSVGELSIPAGFRADSLSTLMILFVTFVGTLIHVYSIGYMAKDPKIGKFFSYLNLFMGSMLILVLADNPVLMFVGWEGVGLCSYLLISFYSESRENVLAGNKAFIVNRVGDFGFALGLVFLFWAIGTHGFDFVSLEQNAHYLSAQMGLIVCLLLFVGATGKSAQIPLYVWLPDAMAGPTPVSALIHAATMVTAGVYMVARFSFLYVHVPLAGNIVAWVGICTALVAAVIAIFQNDIKKILAYSTVSQLGYMFVGVGLAAYSAGIFHVFTHAFFKALLFLAAGSVIHAVHSQDIWDMGGLRKKMPITYLSMLCGGLALAGAPPFSGFFSKDEILYTAIASGHYGIWAIGVLAAGMTTYYMFRLFFVVFHNKPADQHVYDHAHESPLVMTLPLMVLIVGAVGAGFFNLPGLFGGNQLVSGWLGTSVAPHHAHHATSLEWLTIFSSLGVFIIGFSTACLLFFKNARKPLWRFGFSKIASNKFYVDEIYDALLVQPFKGLGAGIWKVFDTWVLDGVVRGVGILYGAAGVVFRFVQSGYARVYAFYMIAGLSLISLFMTQLLD